MSFTIQLTGFTLGASILNVDLYGCTGTTLQCTEQTINDLTNYFQISGHSNILKTELNGRYVVVPDGIKTIKLVPSNLNDGGCILANDYNYIRINTPLTPTPTVTPTSTPTITPTATPTVTPTPTPACVMNGGSAAYTAALNPILPDPITPTFTPTPTPTITPTPTATVDGPTPTPTSTPTVTPTATPTPYYLQLQPCSQAPGTGIVWSRLAFIQSEIQIGEIFYSAGGYYYTVINYQQEQPNPIGTLDGSKASSEYRTCADTPGAYVPPPPTPGVSIEVHTGTTFSNSSEPCNRYESDMFEQKVTLFLSGHTIPAVDDYLYTTAVCVTTFVGNSTYYWAFTSGTKYALKIGSNGQISEVVNCSNVPTFTPTPTPTVTPTPTATPTPYYLQLQPCSQAPGTGIRWSRLAFIQSEIQVGDIFWSAGNAYYSVIGYQQEQPNPIGDIDGSKSTEYTNCSQTPFAYTPPLPTPGVSIAIYLGQTFGNSTEACSLNNSTIFTNYETVFLSGHTTPANGDYVYTTAACNVVYVGNSSYYASLANGTKYSFTIGGNGQIYNVIDCANAPTDTPTPTPTATGTPTPTPTVTPTPTPTETPPPPTLYGVFRSEGLSTFNGHCGNNYSINYPFFGISTSIDSLYGTTVYSDMEYTPLDGGSLWYAVDNDDQENTSNLPYYVMQITSNGEVISVQTITSCGSPGNQT